MKNKKLITLLIIFSLGIIGMLGIVSVTAAKTNNVHPLVEMPLMDLTHENFVEKEALASEVEPMGSSSSGQPVVFGQEFTFSVSDDGTGEDYLEDFKVVRDGVNIILLVTSDAYESYAVDDLYHFANPLGDDSEPWMRSEDIITDEMLDYMVDEFDDNMYPTMMDIYGVPLSRPDDGIDPDRTKVWTLLFNIRDDAYYDPDVGSYIAGYFSLSDSNSNQKNIMHIDTFEWDHRCGSPGDPWFINDDRARPYLYEGTFAHEYEHMIHADIDADEPSWVDEGLADLAGYFCGYGHSESHLAYYFVYHPFTSLTFWGSGLEDYGASYLFQLYLYEKFGGADFTRALVLEPLNGIQGIEKTLESFGYSETFDEIFDAWTIANYLDDPEGGIYGYDTVTIGSTDTWGYSIEYALENMWLGGPFEAPTGFYASWMFGAPQPYLPTYYRFGGPQPLSVALDGDELAGPGPYGGTGWCWYSDVGAWAWRSFSQTFNLEDYADITLDFNTYFEIEWDWDYGYVEVYVHGDDEWYTLNDPSFLMLNDTNDLIPMTDYIAHDQDNPNTPDEREPMTYNATGRWHAFSGASGGWMPVSMDLTPFAGEVIDLYFTTWQDGAFTLQMMYVDNIVITADEVVLESDDVLDEFITDWDSAPNFEGGGTWSIFSGYEANNWQATLIETLWQPTKRYPKDQNWHARKLLNEVHMVMDSGTQSGEITGIRKTPVTSRRTQVLIVSNRADHILPADYWVQFTFT